MKVPSKVPLETPSNITTPRKLGVLRIVALGDIVGGHRDGESTAGGVPGEQRNCPAALQGCPVTRRDSTVDQNGARGVEEGSRRQPDGGAQVRQPPEKVNGSDDNVGATTTLLVCCANSLASAV